MYLMHIFRSLNKVHNFQKCRVLPTLFQTYCTDKKTRRKSAILPKKSTIFALSSSPGMSAVAVIRVSGPNASDVLYRMGKFCSLPSPRKAVLRNVRDPETGTLLDKSLLLWFPSPYSFTGEDVCELHLHGGIAVVKSVLSALAKLPGFVHAVPGEFTKRAFIRGKLDLTEVEGLADLLHAETEAQQQQALRQMEGALFEVHSKWTEQIKKNLANLEAFIDFGEDQNLDSDILDRVTKEILKTENEIKQNLRDEYRGERLRNGITSVLVGRPNVGKSSLLNTICRRDVAIVSPSAGTTRDVLSSCLNIGGYLVHLYDTAGMRECANQVEQEGVKRAQKKSGEADILLFVMEARTVFDMMQNCKVPSGNMLHFFLKKELGTFFMDNPLVSRVLNREYDENQSLKFKKINTMLILNKIDLLNDEEKCAVEALVSQNCLISAVSCVSGAGMNSFMNAFAMKVKDMCCFSVGEEPIITQERHRECIQNCLLNLQEYYKFSKCDVVIAAEKLRNALTELGKITGKVRSDDILDIIFKDFCIGK